MRPRGALPALSFFPASLMLMRFTFLLVAWFALAACEAADDPAATPSATPESTAAPTETPALATLGPAATPPADIEALLTADLARRLGADPSAITVVSVEPVSWPNTCLGVSAPDRVCAQAITPGWLAVLRGPDGREYRYHGSGPRFLFAP